MGVQNQKMKIDKQKEKHKHALVCWVGEWAKTFACLHQDIKRYSTW